MLKLTILVCALFLLKLTATADHTDQRDNRFDNDNEIQYVIKGRIKTK